MLTVAIQYTNYYIKREKEVEDIRAGIVKEVIETIYTKPSMDS